MPQVRQDGTLILDPYVDYRGPAPEAYLSWEDWWNTQFANARTMLYLLPNRKPIEAQRIGAGTA